MHMQVDKHLLENFPRSDINTMGTDVHSIQSYQTGWILLRALSNAVHWISPTSITPMLTLHHDQNQSVFKKIVNSKSFQSVQKFWPLHLLIPQNFEI